MLYLVEAGHLYPAANSPNGRVAQLAEQVTLNH
jgi:hypothetical protein